MDANPTVAATRTPADRQSVIAPQTHAPIRRRRTVRSVRSRVGSAGRNGTPRVPADVLAMVSELDLNQLLDIVIERLRTGVQ